MEIAIEINIEINIGICTSVYNIQFCYSVLRVGWESDILITISMVPRSWLLKYCFSEKKNNFLEK